MSKSKIFDFGRRDSSKLKAYNNRKRLNNAKKINTPKDPELK